MDLKFFNPVTCSVFMLETFSGISRGMFVKPGNAKNVNISSKFNLECS